MAINPSTNPTMAGRITAVDLDYPYGSAKDETAPGAGDGSPYFKARADDLFGFMQALLRLASIVPTGNADTARASQYVQAVEEIAAGRAISYDESGVVNAYILDLRANQQGPAAYFDGMEVGFTVGATNTGASTVNVNSLGLKNIKNASGSNPPAGSISGRVACRYDLANDWFELTPGGVATQAETDAGLNDSKVITPKKMRFGFAVLLATNGYITFPSWMGGLVIQWGINVVSNTATLTTFTTPIAFPSLFFQAVAVHDFPSATNPFTTSIESVSLSELRARVWGDNPSNIRWIAIGH